MLQSRNYTPRGAHIGTYRPYAVGAGGQFKAGFLTRAVFYVRTKSSKQRETWYRAVNRLRLNVHPEPVQQFGVFVDCNGKTQYELTIYDVGALTQEEMEQAQSLDCIQEWHYVMDTRIPRGAAPKLHGPSIAKYRSFPRRMAKPNAPLAHRII